MSFYARRLKLLQTKLAEEKLDALLVSNGLNIYYLTGFRGANPQERESLVLVKPETAYLFVPQMYQSEAALIEGIEVVVLPAGKRYFEVIQTYINTDELLAFESDNLKYLEFERLHSIFPAHKPTLGLVSGLRIVKDPEELLLIEKAAYIADESLRQVLPLIKRGITEKQVARKLEHIMDGLGSEKPAFETIVASGTNTALPHHRTSDKVLKKNEPVLIDFGAVVQGYCSDMTRTLYIGAVPDDFRKVYELVLQAHDRAARTVKAGVPGELVHNLVLDTFGQQAEYLPHSTGHGVGLEVHEGPHLSLQVKEKLEENMVVTVEPGLYYPGKFGVRIEDLGLVTETVFQSLYTSSPELITL